MPGSSTTPPTHAEPHHRLGEVLVKIASALPRDRASVRDLTYLTAASADPLHAHALAMMLLTMGRRLTRYVRLRHAVARRLEKAGHPEEAAILREYVARPPVKRTSTRAATHCRTSGKRATKAVRKRRTARRASGVGASRTTTIPHVAGIDVDAIVERVVDAATARIRDLASNLLIQRHVQPSEENTVGSEPLARACAQSPYSESESTLTVYREESPSESSEHESVTSDSENKGENPQLPSLFGTLQVQRPVSPKRRKALELVEPAVRIWNILAEHRKLRRVVKMTPERRKKLARALEEVCECNIEIWTEACRQVARSRFLCGRNERGWQCTIDFMSRPTALARVLEGVYGDRRAYQTGHDGADVAAGALEILAARRARNMPIAARQRLTSDDFDGAGTHLPAEPIDAWRASQAPWRRALRD